MENQSINRKYSKFAGVITSLFYVAAALFFALLVIWGIHLIMEISQNHPISWVTFLPDMPYLTNILFPFASYLGVHAGIIITVLASLLFIFSVFGFVSCTMIVKFSKLDIIEYKKVYKLINFNVFILFVLFFIFFDFTIVNAFTGEMKIENIVLIFVSIIPLICALLFLADKQKNVKLEAEYENLGEDTTSEAFSFNNNELENESEWVFSLEENKPNYEQKPTEESKTEKDNFSQPREIVENKKDTSFFDLTPSRPLFEQNSKAPPLQTNTTIQAFSTPTQNSSIPTTPPPPPKPPAVPLKSEQRTSSEDKWIDFNFNVDGSVSNVSTTPPAKPVPPSPPNIQPPKTLEKSKLDIIQDKLMELRNLLAVGAITKEEFEEERDKLISDI